MEVMDTHGKHGEELTENGTVTIVTVDSKQHQNNRNEKTLIDSSTRENMLGLQKSFRKEQEDVHGVQIIFLMAHANVLNSIISVNMLILIHWLTLLNYVIVATQKKPINKEKPNPEENFTSS